MCGIIGYVGKKSVVPTLVRGLRRLEYRGYDSSGIAWFDGSNVVSIKAAGKLDVMVDQLGEHLLHDQHKTSLQSGIGHTRWATHGAPTTINAHPHVGCKRALYVVHNGIIENFAELKAELQEKNHTFLSDTDTEVLAHLIEDALLTHPNLEEAVRATLQRVRGTYGLLVLDQETPNSIVVARNGSPVVIGVADGEYIIASDLSPIMEHTNNVVYLEDGEMATVDGSGVAITTIQSRDKVERPGQTIEWTSAEVERGGYPHFMLKEIFEQPAAILSATRGRTILDRGLAKLGGLELVADQLAHARRIVIIGCGTSYHAALVGKYQIEEYASIPVEAVVASEFRYRKPVLDKHTVVIAMSQSGETADTIAGIQEAKQKGCLTLGVVNVVGSTIARMTDAGVYLHVGPEIGVASTKAYVGMTTVLTLIALMLGRQRQLSLVMGERIIQELQELPKKVEHILSERSHIASLAKKYQNFTNFLYLGRKYNYPSALEGALKFKEITYVHAEGFPAGELKHGPLAMIDEHFASIFLAPQDSVYEKSLSNLQELRARGGPVIAVVTEGDDRILKLTSDIITIPKTLEMLTPILMSVPLQLFAYEFAVGRGCDVDKPRNLAKSVTVE
ncbi:MAG: glutamine--fructose-6-phosphate transaminase (isomerizing) [Patescibacteria group bacterium]|jgi:glucosamine--fructose-6-phosphate aminotransferase (isomerizing)